MQGETSGSVIAQTAIATKKRLYAKALDSLTSTSKTALVTTDSVKSAKRPATPAAAFDEARERAAKRLRHSTSGSSIPPPLVPTKTATPKKDDSHEPPNFAPWSHEAFLTRLKTFSSVSVWHPKPETINEVEWAKRGWVCVDVNTVRCKGGCEKRVVVDTGSIAKGRQAHDGESVDIEEDTGDDEAAFEQALAERYKEVIVNGHAENCLWRKSGCKDDIYHLQVVRPSVWQPELRKRFRSVLEVGVSVEKVKLRVANTTSSKTLPPERLLKDLPADVLGESAKEMEASKCQTALSVALHGWHGLKDSGTELLRCDACFQRVGLWMYQPDYRPSHATSEDLKDDEEEDSTLDLVELHREHCPWRNPITQKASGSLSGLNASEILQRVVSTYARDHRRRSDEQTGVATAETGQDVVAEVPTYSKEEVARQDKERESRLRKLKSLFSIKRRSTKAVPKTTAR